MEPGLPCDAMAKRSIRSVRGQTRRGGTVVSVLGLWQLVTSAAAAATVPANNLRWLPASVSALTELDRTLLARIWQLWFVGGAGLPIAATKAAGKRSLIGPTVYLVGGPWTWHNHTHLSRRTSRTIRTAALAWMKDVFNPWHQVGKRNHRCVISCDNSYSLSVLWNGLMPGTLRTRWHLHCN